jgi:hypothetical protein
LFFVCQSGDTYPQLAYIWSEDQELWIGTLYWTEGVTATIELFDSLGQPRFVHYEEVSAAGDSVAFMLGCQHNRGVPSAVTPVNGTALLAANAWTVGCTGATWGTDTLVGVPIRVRHVSGAVDDRIVESNTAALITVTEDFSEVVQAGATFELGFIEAVYRTGRIFAGFPDRKKKWKELWIWARYNVAAMPFKVRAYLDGALVPTSDFATLAAEDGVSMVAAVPGIQVDPTVQAHRFRVPVMEQDAVDAQIEVRSSQGGTPWEIHAMRLVYEVDDSEHPRGKGAT